MPIQVACGVRTCYGCRGASDGRRENYAYSECGLKNIVLKDVMVYRCRTCGMESVDIPNMDGLHRSIALTVLCKGSMVNGDEIRFLRKVVGLSATALAKNLGVTKVAVSRWENGSKIGGPCDRLIRLVCGFAIIREILDERSGPVEPETVTKTLQKLQEFVSAFNPSEVLSAIQGESRDEEKLLIDPEMPLGFSALPSQCTEHAERIQ
jgi:putative zinc finger/helix-turn-helix YgiT family protein